MEGQADLFGTVAAELVLVQARPIAGKWSVVFQQTHDGVPVLGGRAHVVFDDAGRLLAAGSDLYPEITVPDTGALSREEARDVAKRKIGYRDGRDREATEASLVIVPFAGESGMSYRLAHRYVLEVSDPPGVWSTLVDAETGEILQRRDIRLSLDIEGDVRSQVGDKPAVCAAEVEDPSPALSVSFSGLGTATTGSDGGFSIAGASGPTPFSATLDGLFVDTSVCSPVADANNPCQLSGPADALVTGLASSGVALEIRFDDTNSGRDERTVYHFVNAAHDEIKAVDPGLGGIDTPIPVATRVPAGGVCPGNAWYQDDTQRIYFCDGGSNDRGSFANMAELADVVVHEWGHFLTDVIYPGPFAVGDPPLDLHEGNADILTNFMLGRPEIGLGYETGQCTSGFRSSDSYLDVRFDWGELEVHHQGSILAGVVWEFWKALELSLDDPALARATALELWHASRALFLPGAASGTSSSSADIQRDQVLAMFVFDDDDASLLNGTPHYAELCVAAARHGFEGPGPPCPPFATPFAAQNVTLQAWLDGHQFDDYVTGLGSYVDAGGREYALVGWRESISVVDVSTPTAPQVIATVPAPGPVGVPASMRTGTREIAVYGQYAYVVSAYQAGVVVLDLSLVSSAIVQASTVLPGVSFDSYIALEVDSANGFAYAAGADIAGRGVQILDLSNPASPTLGAVFSQIQAGDIDVRSFAAGPHAGREILVVSGRPATPNQYETYLVDVTNKSSLVVAGVLVTPPRIQAHHYGRLSANGDRLYLGDRNDEIFAAFAGNPGPTEMAVYDVTDLATPTLLDTFALGPSFNAADYDIELIEPFALLVNGSAGLRIHDVTNPSLAPEVAYHATHPHPDLTLIGAFALDVALPSRTILVADVSRGLFVFDASDVLPTPACSNNVDDDGDGKIDFPLDLGCSAPGDSDESGSSPQCSDGIDNDGDGLIDFPNDPACVNAQGNDEEPQCQDGQDNDGDGAIDWAGGPGGEPADPQCQGKPWRNAESSGCGLGFELVFLIPLLRLRSAYRRDAKTRPLDSARES